jgi:hypothetical protein
MIVKRLMKMVNARALYLAIIISFVAAVLSFIFILSKYYSYTEIYNLKTLQRLSDNTLSAINILSRHSGFIPYNIEKTVALFDDSVNQATVIKRRWGVYNMCSAKSSWKRFSVQKAALYGQKTSGKNATGLYLTDQGHYLAVSGDTYLSGRLFLPKLGIRKAYIDGNSFKYEKIIEGTMENSEEHLPSLSNQFLEYVKNELFVQNFKGDSLVSASILSAAKIENSFFNRPIRIYSTGSIDLRKIEIFGNFIIQSDDAITINSNCHLENVICVAPQIIIESGFKGRAQFFGNDTVKIMKNVTLQYPSAVVSAGMNHSTSHVLISEASRVEGTILGFAEIELNRNVSVILENYTEIYGMVYSAGKVSIQGKVFGSLFCNLFFLQTRQGYYENQLLNAWIDPSGLEPQFSSGAIVDIDSLKQNNTIISWLN